MERDILYTEAAGLILERLAGNGIFLNTPGNTMTIGWASLGVYWGLPTFVALVRPQRDSFERINRAGEFTVSVPTSDPLRAQLAMAGSLSGRDIDKFQGRGLTAAPARLVSAPIIQECGLHLECKVRYRQAMTETDMDKSVLKKAYPDRDFHVLYYGEIVACYRTDLE